ncbi:MAG: Gmad2 immunoglobulin-like domain-containing protein, partial [bacterium]|nr:Gmad2 immunoglobulin-like domain-containing protein [bacterium]
WKFTKKEAPAAVSSFEECVAAGNPVMESWPRKCRNKTQTFIENLAEIPEGPPNVLAEILSKADLIRLDWPKAGQEISSPLEITGEARGVWFFEASFPVFLVDWDGRIIAQGIATAHPPAGGDWMTENFVPFKAKLEFTVEKDIYSNRGALILKKDNPSGLPEHDDALEIPVVFK